MTTSSGSGTILKVGGPVLKKVDGGGGGGGGDSDTFILTFTLWVGGSPPT